jgi:hypothetical protein
MNTASTIISSLTVAAFMIACAPADPAIQPEPAPPPTEPDTIPQEPPPTEPPPPPAASAATTDFQLAALHATTDRVRVALRPVGEGVQATGELLLEGTPDGETELVIEVRDAPADLELEASLIEGTCEEPLGDVAPLLPVEIGPDGAGESMAMLNVPVEALVASPVALQLTPTDAGAEPLLCGVIDRNDDEATPAV